MKIGALYAGVGGLERGLEMALDGQTVWQVENNPYARRVLERRFPNADRTVADIRLAGAHNLAPVRLMCGGFPCQNTSTASRGVKQNDLEGAKSGLWYEFKRIVGELDPEFVVVENVYDRWPHWLPVVRRHLWTLGYASVPFRVRASDVGAPHVRRRLFLVSYSNGHGKPPRAVHEEVARVCRVSGLGRWPRPPNDLGMDDGIPFRMDRLRVLGNAVVPQCAYLIGLYVRALRMWIDGELE